MPQEKFAESTSTYAVAGDFCRVFVEEMSRLYLLSFLLTGDRGKAEQCFVSALEDCIGSNQVFRNWTDSWARRAIIQNAIRILQPFTEPTEESSRGQSEIGHIAVPASEAPFAAVVGLKPFERVVFVLTVLERYSDQDCRIFLECSRQEVVQARRLALEQMARSSEALALPAVPSAGEAFAQAS